MVGADKTDEMLSKARATAASMGLAHVEFRKGLAEDLPVASGWADVILSNGVINLCADKRSVIREMARVLRPGGRLLIGDFGKWSYWAARRRIRGWFGATLWGAGRFRSANELASKISSAGLIIGAIRGARSSSRLGHHSPV